MRQSPTDPAFVQDPYPVYDLWRAQGDLVWWEDYGMVAATSHRAVHTLLKDRRFGRAVPPAQAHPIPERLTPFYDIEAHSLLELEAPDHTRLRGLILRAFTSRTIAALGPFIDDLAATLVADLPPPGTPVDLLDALCRPLPVRVIAHMLGGPASRCTDLLDWSNAMVGMYQAGRTRAMEDAAVAASRAFSAFLSDLIETRRAAPGDDLLSQLIAAEEDGERLSRAELISTVILLLNAGHEATVHTLGNGIATLIATGQGARACDPQALPALTEEVLRHDPPLHLFTRWCYTEVELYGHRFRPGDQVACLLGAANRDPDTFADPAAFAPGRNARAQVSFGAGIHFCVGAPLARMEIAAALRALFSARPDLTLAEPPRYAPIYHFHGLEALRVV